MTEEQLIMNKSLHFIVVPLLNEIVSVAVTISEKQ